MSEKDIYNSKLKKIEEKVVGNTIRNTRDMALKHPRHDINLPLLEPCLLDVR